MSKRMMSSISIIFLILIISGCNLPSRAVSSTETELPDVVYTSAAETTEAKISATSSPTNQVTSATNTPEKIESVDTPEPTASATVTITITPTKIPEIIYFDDFSDMTSWYIHEDDRYGFKYTTDGYQIYNNVTMGLIWSIRDQEYSGIALEVDGTRLIGSDDSYFGVVCKFADDGANYYALVIGDNGFYGFGLMEDGEYEFIETGIDEEDVIKRGLGETNRIRGVCNDNHFLIFANGELLLDTWDDTLEEGIIGLVVGNQRSDSGAEFRFNDFAITWP